MLMSQYGDESLAVTSKRSIDFEAEYLQMRHIPKQFNDRRWLSPND